MSSILAFCALGLGRRGFVRTVAFNLSFAALYDAAEVWPFGQIFKIEADVEGFRERIEVAAVEMGEISSCHGPDGSHLECADGTVVD
jgi:hypothetical protein